MFSAVGTGIIYTFGNPTYGNGPFERIGVPTTVPLLAGFLAACVVQVAGGALLVGVQSPVRVAQRGRDAHILGVGVDGAEGILTWSERRWQIFRIGKLVRSPAEAPVRPSFLDSRLPGTS